MLTFFVAATLLSVGSQAPVSLQGALVHPRRLIVETTHPLGATSILATGSKIVRNLSQIHRFVVETPPNRLVATRHLLQMLPGIRNVDWDKAARPAYTPNDPLWANQWHVRDIKVDQAWDLSFGSSNILVAVIDTGINPNHEDLIGNLWDNDDEIPNNGIDDDNDGLIDNKYGYDFAYNDPIPDDYYGHGTPCAGIIAAVTDNGKGIAGIAPQAKIVALKTCTNEGYLFDSNNIPAYLWAADNGIKIFSMSYYTDADVTSAGGAAFDYVLSKGVLPIAAAGNDAQIWNYYPAGYEGVVAVAATDGGTSKAGFSNYGTWVDLAAPGSGLISTSASGGYTGFGGTSGACPHVAGVAALIWGANPSMTAAAVRAAMEDTATPVNQWPFGEYANYGVLNARQAMEVAQGMATPGQSPLVRYMTPVALSTKTSPPSQTGSVRIHGRGFQQPRNIEVRWNATLLPILQQQRDFVDVAIPRLRKSPGPDILTIRVDGQTIKTISLPTDRRSIYGAIEASSAGGTATGSFFDLLAGDGTEGVGYNRGNGTIYYQTQFRRVGKPGAASLIYRRRYSGGGGSEAIYLYHWTHSLPYGSWVTIYSGHAPTFPETIEIAVPNFDRFIDPEGSVYGFIYAEGIGSGGHLYVDQLNLAVKD